MRACLCLALLSVGCDDEMVQPNPDLTVVMNADLSAVSDLSTVIDRGPTSLAVDFEPSGLYWDSPSQALYISTGSNQIVKWSDAGGFERLATVPFAFAAQGNNLSSLVRLADGRIVVDVIGQNGNNAAGMPQFVNGNILIISTAGVVSAVPGLNQKRQRQGLTLAPDGTIYSCWFVANGSGNPAGGVSKVDLTAGETDVWLGLSKPYGLVVDATTIYVADQKDSAIYKLALSSMDVDGGATMKLATVTTPDLMTLGQGDLFAGGPQVSRIKPDGTVSAFSATMRNVRGVAYDGDHQRLFAAEPDVKFPDAGVMALLHILPVD